ADDVALVRNSTHHCAIKRFDSLGICKWGVERPRDVVSEVITAHRQRVDLDELARGEDGDRGGAAADIYAYRTLLALLLGCGGKRAGIARGRQAGDAKLAALSEELQRPDRRDVGGGSMELRGEPAAGKAVRCSLHRLPVDAVAESVQRHDRAP